MGIKSFLKTKGQGYLEQRKESKAFSDEVRMETLKIRREQFKKEAIKQASIQGKRMAIEKANRPTLGQRVSAYAKAQSTKKPGVKRKSLQFSDLI